MIYYKQTKGGSIRRYPNLTTEVGERYDPAEGKWVKECCSQSACIFTKDEIIPKSQVPFA